MEGGSDAEREELTREPFFRRCEGPEGVASFFEPQYAVGTAILGPVDRVDRALRISYIPAGIRAPSSSKIGKFPKANRALWFGS